MLELKSLQDLYLQAFLYTINAHIIIKYNIIYYYI